MCHAVHAVLDNHGVLAMAYTSDTMQVMEKHITRSMRVYRLWWYWCNTKVHSTPRAEVDIHGWCAARSAHNNEKRQA